MFMRMTVDFAFTRSDKHREESKEAAMGGKTLPGELCTFT